MTSTVTARTIRAEPEAVWRAFTTAELLTAWLPPGDMTGRMHVFDLRPGGGYEMSLYYPEGDGGAPGKTDSLEDRVRVRFVELAQPGRLVEAAVFDSDDAGMRGEMRIVITIDPAPAGSRVTMRFDDLPPGLRPEDNDAGARQSLEKLARLLE